MHCSIQEYEVVKEAAMKFVKSVAEGSSKYAKELSSLMPFCLVSLTERWSTAPSSSYITTLTP